MNLMCNMMTSQLSYIIMAISQCPIAGGLNILKYLMNLKYTVVFTDKFITCMCNN